MSSICKFCDDFVERCGVWVLIADFECAGRVFKSKSIDEEEEEMMKEDV